MATARATGWWLPPSRWSARRARFLGRQTDRGLSYWSISHRPCSWEDVGRSHDRRFTGGRQAIDAESLRTAPLKDAPMLTAGEIGRRAVSDARRRRQGGRLREEGDQERDLVLFPLSHLLFFFFFFCSSSRKIPFGEGMLGEKVRGFDRDFLVALAGAAATARGDGRNPGRHQSRPCRGSGRRTPAADIRPLTLTSTAMISCDACR